MNSRLRPSTAGLLAALIALIFSAAIALWAPPASGRLDVGSPGDDPFVNSFFRAESNSVETFRWMSDHATIRIPVDRSGDYRLDLALAAVSPGDRTLRLACGQHVREIPLSERSGNFTVSLDCSTPDDTITLTLDVPVVYLPPGGRALGVSVRNLTVTPLGDAGRILLRARIALTVLSALAGAMLALAAPGFRRYLWIAGLAVPAVAWLLVAGRDPDLLLATTTGPGGLLALAGGLAAWLLARRQRGAALATAALTPLIVVASPPRPLVRLLEGTWTAPDDAALRLFPWLAVGAIAGAALIGGARAHWLAAGGSVCAAGSLFLGAAVPGIASRWSHQISVPSWTDVASSGGAIYLVTAFALTGLAMLAALARPARLPLLTALVAGAGIAALLAWRIEVMQLNGDEPHYYVTARSLGHDGDLELLNNYLEPLYREAAYSPVGNLAVARDDDANRYAAYAPAPEGAWYLTPDLPGWQPVQGEAGPQQATGAPPRLEGPDGAVSRPPPLTPDTRQIMLLGAPCRVERLQVAAADGSAPGIAVRVLDPAGAVLWERGGLAPGEIQIPADSGLCRGAGPWAVVVESDGAPVVAEAVDTYRGLQLAGGGVARSWVFAGLPRDRYGSRSAAARLLLHNPTDSTVLAIVRLVGGSNRTVFEIAIGLPPGATVREPVPVSGSAAVQVEVFEEAQINARLVGSLEPARYDVPSTRPVTAWAAVVPPSPGRDGGLWLTVLNPDSAAHEFVLYDGAQARRIEVCGLCGETMLLPGGDRAREVRVRWADGQPFLPAAVEYQERTGSLHFDLGLPFVAAPLARWNAVWPVFLVPALAGILLAPGLLALLSGLGVERRTAAASAVAVAMLAPASTYAVRLYTEILAAALIVWALYCWRRAWERSTWDVPVLLIAVWLPFLHGRLAPLAVVLAVLAASDLLRRAAHTDPRSWVTGRNLVIAAAILAGGGILLAIRSQYAVGLTSRNVERYFHLIWVLPNSAGMLLDRGSGVLPFAPWVLLGLAAPLPLRRVQRAGLLLVLVYFGVMTLRAGGWQTWGAPIRYLLPILPLLALLAVPGAIRLWHAGAWGRVAVLAALTWSLLATMLLHWLPLSGYVTADGRYLIDEALRDLLRLSPFRIFPAILPEPGPEWGRAIGLVILLALAVLAAWIARPLFLPGRCEQRGAEPVTSLEAPGDG